MSVKHASEEYGIDWRLHYDQTTDGSRSYTIDRIQLILLQEIRDQLKKINATLDCHNTRSVPATLRRIDRRLALRIPFEKGRSK